MKASRKLSAAVLPLLSVMAIVGCASERAQIEFSYMVQPVRGLPPGMTTLTIDPVKQSGPNTDPKWSDLVSTSINHLVNESASEFGTKVVISNRRDSDVTFEEADLAAAGSSTGKPGTGGKLLAAQGAIRSNINVKVEKHVGRARTISGIQAWGGGGHGWGHGGGDVQTEEVETVTRNMTVQAEFKLIDTANNREWETYAPKTFRSTERTRTSPLFGSSQTEAELTPQDAIIGTLVEKAAREFISRLIPTKITVDVEVFASGHEMSMQGVRQLRAQMYDDALASFKAALAENSNDHQSAFGAGVAAEAAGQYQEALRFYQQACAGQDNPDYAEARDRMKEFGSRAKPVTG